MLGRQRPEALRIDPDVDTFDAIESLSVLHHDRVSKSLVRADRQVDVRALSTVVANVADVVEKLIDDSQVRMDRSKRGESRVELHATAEEHLVNAMRGDESGHGRFSRITGTIL